MYIYPIGYSLFAILYWLLPIAAACPASVWPCHPWRPKHGSFSQMCGHLAAVQRWPWPQIKHSLWAAGPSVAT